MAGLLTHLSVSFAGILLAYFFWDYKYGLSFAIGHLTPDLLDFGIAGIAEGSLNPTVIMTNPLFRPLAILGHTFTNWIALGSILLIILFLFYRFHKIPRDKAVMIAIFIGVFILGVLIHVIFDALVIETNHWI